MRIAIGSDHAGWELKERLKAVLAEMGHQVLDMGCSGPESTDYPLYGREVAKRVASGEVDRGVLICGTGLGMSITANRFKGVRAALCHEPFSAKMSRAHNDSNCLCLGARVIGRAMAEEILKVWLETEFEGGRHERRLCMIDEGSRG